MLQIPNYRWETDYFWLHDILEPNIVNDFNHYSSQDAPFMVSIFRISKHVLVVIPIA